MYALEDLKNRVRSRQSRRYIDEAISAYGAGAYRSAIIAVWIAVAADIIEKIRFLAEEAMPVAVELRDKLDRAITDKNIAGLQAFERDLLNAAEKRLNLIGSREATELGRLYEDRHLCAHPAFVSGDDDLFAPTAELVRTHLASAVDALLSHRAVTGRKTIERFQRDVQEESYPRDDHRLEEFLRAGYLDHVSRPVLGNLIKVACKGTLDPANSIALRWRYSRAARVMQKIAPAAFEEEAAKLLEARQDALNDDGLFLLVSGLCYVPGTWDLLHEGTRNRIEQLLSAHSILQLVVGHQLFHGPLPCTPVDRMLLARVPDMVGISAAQLVPGQQLADYLGPLPDRRLIGPIVQALADVKSYMDGEAVLKLLNALTTILTGEDLQGILMVCAENDQVRGSVLGHRQLAILRSQTHDLDDHAEQAWAKWDSQWQSSTPADGTASE
ncbi:hypothetical protein [Kitasatospora sp. NPDC050463]|uniref:hypothetical protein n=1 Tax=Kitasatospora sp. NPDC050463 TaxID=3155786 RepID=UPI0033CA035F